MIFIVFTRIGDVHASHIQSILALQNHELVILERENYGKSWNISSLENDEIQIFIQVEDRIISHHDISAIWHRVNFTVEKISFPELSESENSYVAAQRSIHVNSALRALSDLVPCMNSPLANWNAQSKTLQAVRAKSVGLRIPRGFRGGSPPLARNFLTYDSSIRICSKPLEAVHLDYDGAKFAKMTRIVDYNETMERIDTLADCPLILQEYVQKEYELRVTIVGNEIFSCAIDASRANSESQMDWRNYDLANTPHWVQELPIEVAKKLLDLHKSFNLVYGAYDLIKTSADEYYFLEVNSMGQWLWIEDLTDLPISNAVAVALIYLANGKI